MYLTRLADNSVVFPSTLHALHEPNGLLAYGGDLSTSRLKEAYRLGIFPWFDADEPILWWSPDPRAVLLPDEIVISRSMAKFLRRSPYHITVNHAFSRVIHTCAEIRHGHTWISTEVEEAYNELHRQGVAHSVEAWLGEQLVGGLYGVAQGALFCGESMFSLANNASKCALIAFCQHFIHFGGKLIDCQIINPHTASLGAKNISRALFLRKLTELQHASLAVECWHQQTINDAKNSQDQRK